MTPEECAIVDAKVAELQVINAACQCGHRGWQHAPESDGARCRRCECPEFIHPDQLPEELAHLAVEPEPVIEVRETRVTPWFTGTRTLSGVRVTMGRDHVGPALAELLRTGQPLAVDLENEGLKPPASEMLHCVGIGTATDVVVLDPRDAQQRDMARMALGAAPVLVFHNSPFDVPILVRAGVMPREAVWRVVDTVIYGRLAYPSQIESKALGALAHKLLGRPKPGADPLALAAKAEGLTKSKMFERYDIDRPLYVEGNALDVAATAALYPVIRKAALDHLTRGAEIYTEFGVTGSDAERLVDREQIVNRVMLARSVKGLRVDLDFADAFADRYDSELAKAAQMLGSAGITAGDSASLVAWCDKQGLIPGPDKHPRLKNGQPSGGKKYLERLRHPLVKLFVAQKEQVKIQRDYITKIRDHSINGRIHPMVNILGAVATGRMSYSGDPLQQYPAGARGIVLAEEFDPFTSIDWSQIEPVIAANLAGDLSLLAGYESGTSDPYQSIADIAALTRKQGKTVMLADMYGQGIGLLSSNLNVDEATARRIKQAAQSAYADTVSHFDSIKQAAGRHLLVPTVSGRMLPVPRKFNEEREQWEVATYMGVNYHIQGSAYDLLAESIVAIHEAGLSESLYLAIHDELVVSTSAAAEVQRIMATPPRALVERAGRTPILRTDANDMGQRWAYV